MSATLCNPRQSRSSAGRSPFGRLWPLGAFAILLCSSVGRADPKTAHPRLVAAVVSLAEPRDYRGRAIGARAAAWLQRLLTDAGRWQMIPRTRALSLERRLGLKPPMQAGELQRIGAKLGAHLVVSGAVGSAKLDFRRHAAAAAVRVEVTDVATGELLAAANATGTSAASRSRPLPTDVIVERALAEACRAACKRLLAERPVVAQLAAVAGRNEYIVDAGRAAGLTKARKCLVLRSDGGVLDCVAVVIIREASEARSKAVVLSSVESPRPGDLVMAP